MPTWIFNDLKIKANKKTMTAIRKKLLTEQGDLSYALLIPDQYDNPNYRVKAELANITVEDYREADGSIYDWYNFHIDHWGCKWDVYERGFYL